jgi:uncharacterized protein YceK
MRQLQLKTLLYAYAVVVSGCASMISGTNQSLSVSTTGCPGATCQLKNSKGTWYVTAPGSATVHRGYGDLSVTCKKEGFPDATAQVSSSTKIATGANVVWGVLLPVEAGVDMATGAAYDYPAEIVVTMDCTTSPPQTGNGASHE